MKYLIPTTIALFIVLSSVVFAAGLKAPSNLVTTVVSSSQIDLTWQDNSRNETGFRIIRSLTGQPGSWYLIATVGANVTNYSDTGLNPSTTYYYYVQAYKGNQSASSNTTSATTFPDEPQLPAAPSNLTAIVTDYYYDATSSITYAWIKLDWQDNSSNETGFRIERSTDGTNFDYTGGVGANITTWTDFVPVGYTYWYRVYAWNNGGNSDYSNVASVTP